MRETKPFTFSPSLCDSSGSRAGGLQRFEAQCGGEGGPNGRGWLTALVGGRAPWLLGGGAAVTGMYYLNCLETIPYTGRRHSLMLVSRQQEQAIGKFVFETVRSGGGSWRWACKLVFKMFTSIEFEKVRRVAAAAEAPRGAYACLSQEVHTCPPAVFFCYSSCAPPDHQPSLRDGAPEGYLPSITYLSPQHT